MSAIKIMWPASWDAEAAQSRIVKYLRENGYEVNTERKGWRVFMFRRDHKQWTQVYTGLTSIAKDVRNGFKITGLEQQAIPKHAFYENGIFCL